MKSATALVTVEEFRRLPEPADGSVLELWHGEVVHLTRPRKRHDDCQLRIRRLLQPFADRLGVLKEEMSFRAEPEYELRVADVGFVIQSRWDATDPDDYLRGAPELVIEIESPSNTAAELKDKQLLCLAHGCQEFWTVYPQLELVEVATPESIRHYRRGETIPLRTFPGETLPVDRLFA